MTKEEVKRLPTLQEVVDQILMEEAQIVKLDSPPIATIEPSPSAIHKPFAEYFNDYDDKKFIAVRLSSRDPLNEDILDETNSILIDPMNVEEIAVALKRIKDNKQFRNRLSEGAIAKAAELRIDIRTKKILEFIKRKIKK